VEIATQTAPFQYGAADGVAYWTEEGGAGSAAWRLDLATGERATLAAGEAPPPFDTRRYEAALLAAPALGFAVSDRRPVLTLTVRHATPAWGADAELDALLTSAAGAPLQGAVVRLQRLSGGRWVNVWLDVTAADGAASFLYRPAATTELRVTFAPPATQPAGREYLSARSRTQTLAPHVLLATPKAPATADQGALITVAGDLTPRHPAGEKTVRLVYQRRGAGGEWVTRLTASAVNRVRSGSAATRYVGHARLAPGAWRVQAVHPADAEHAETLSSWRSFTVR
jgi:hypothetical protein